MTDSKKAGIREPRSSRLSQTQTLESNVDTAPASRVGNPEPARHPHPRSGRGPLMHKSCENLKPAARNTSPAREKPHSLILEEACLPDILLHRMSGPWGPLVTEGTVTGVTVLLDGQHLGVGVSGEEEGRQSHGVSPIAGNPNAQSQLHAMVSVPLPEMPGMALLVVQHENNVVCHVRLCVCVCVCAFPRNPTCSPVKLQIKSMHMCGYVWMRSFF